MFILILSFIYYSPFAPFAAFAGTIVLFYCTDMAIFYYIHLYCIYVLSACKCIFYVYILILTAESSEF